MHGGLRGRRALVLAWVAAAGAAGCGGGSGTAGGSVPRAQIEDELHAATCRLEVRCETMPDLDACLAATSSPISPQLRADLDSGSVVYDAGGGRALVDSFDGLSCLRSQTETPEGRRARLERWRAAFRGTVPAGGACVIDDQCPAAGCSRPGCSTPCCQGTCRASKPVAARGAACGPSVSCQADSVCGPLDLTTLMGTCIARPGIDGDCQLGACAAGLACAAAPPAGALVCQSYPATGAACVPGGDVPCDDRRDACDPMSMTCLRRLASGAACTTPGLPCRADNRCDQGTCTPVGASVAPPGVAACP